MGLGGRTMQLGPGDMPRLRLDDELRNKMAEVYCGSGLSLPWNDDAKPHDAEGNLWERAALSLSTNVKKTLK